MGEPRDGIPFGSYRLIKRLARGGMAEVFLATQRGLEGFERRVAVKRILPHLVESTEFVEMFLDEARLAARLNHPNIVHIYEFGKVDEYYFIAMEYVDGVDTNQMILETAGKGIPPEIVARIGADSAAGLHHAHQLSDEDGRPVGIVHRDVSPQNLLCSYDGVMKLVDFGIAKAAHHAERTRPGVVKGKFAYMSPEQVVGRTLDGRSDVFSLAIVLWELLAGRYAYTRESPGEAMREIRDGRLVPIESVKTDVPRELAAVLGRALTKERDKRPNAAQFAVELESYLKSSTKLATSLVVAEWLKERFPRRDLSGQAPKLPAQTPPATEAGTEHLPSDPSRDPTLPMTSGQDMMVEDETLDVPREDPTLPPPPRSGVVATLPATGAPLPNPPSEVPITISDLFAKQKVSPSSASQSAPRVRHISAPRPAQPVTMTTAQTRLGSRQLVRIGAAALGVLAGIVVIAVAMGEDPKPKPRTDRPLREPAPAPVAQLPPPAPAVDAVAPVAEPLEPEKTPPLATPLASVEVITTPPGASVVLDGIPLLGVTPLHVDDIEPGDHAIIVSLPGYREETRLLTLDKTTTWKLEIALAPLKTRTVAQKRAKPQPTQARARPATGYLTVNTVPWSDVFVGGRKLGQAPLAEKEVPAGTYRIVFKNPAFGRRERKVTIRPGDTTKLNLDFRDQQK